jgi:beta-lactamase class A
MSRVKPSRRGLLQALGAGSLLLWAGPAWADQAWQISYGACADLDEALDQQAEVEAVLGSELVAQMGVVLRPDRSYHVVLPVTGGQAAAEQLAARHDALLAQAWGDQAGLTSVIAVTSAEALYNVSYGLGPNFDALKDSYSQVTRMLGSGVARDLVIERTPKGNYALVYRRYGDLESSRTVALRHDKLLRSAGLDAALIRHQNNPVVWTGTSAEARPSESIRRPVESPPAEQPEDLATQVDRPRLAPAEVPEVPEVPASSVGEPRLVETLAQVEPPEATEPERPIEQPIERPSAQPMEPGETALTRAIDAHVKELRQAGMVSGDEGTSWLVYDLASDAPLASINGSLARQCASMVKPLVALAFFHREAAGELVYGPESTARFEAMIQKSSNTATDWAIKQVGGPSAVQQILQQHYPHIFQDTQVVEYIGSSGRTYKNRASAADLGRFLRALWADELPKSAELKRLMNLPGRDRIYDGAPAIPVGTQVYNKTGSTSMCCGDMGILVAQKSAGGTWPYVLVGVIEKSSRASSYSSWIRTRAKVIRSVSNLVYTQLKPARGLK